MRVKTVPARIKTADEKGGEDTGEFEAIVSAFGNTDAVGDVVLPGAFKDTLETWSKSGNPIPVIWSHDHRNPDANLGPVLEAKETDEGLWVKGQVDLDEPFAAKVYRLMKSRRVTKFSFAYDMKDYEENDQGGFNLKALDIWEVGPTLIPANSETELLAVKNLLENEGMDVKELARLLRELSSATGGMKAGRVLSAKNESLLSEIAADLKSATDRLGGLVKSVQTAGDDEGKAREGKPAGDGKPAESKSEKDEETKPATGDQPAKPQPADADIKMALQMLDLEIDVY